MKSLDRRPDGSGIGSGGPSLLAEYVVYALATPCQNSPDMCIAFLSTAHPEYVLVLLSNRDEYLHRPTAPLEFWPPENNILAGRDLYRPVHGTWLGITRTGRLGVLTNYRESVAAGGAATASQAPFSRGAIAKSWLEGKDGEGVKEWVAKVGKDVCSVGGFNFVFGTLERGMAGRGGRCKDDKQKCEDGEESGLFVISNRTSLADGPKLIIPPRRLGRDGKIFGHTRSLTNSFYGDTSWPKSVLGERLVEEMITKDVHRRQERRKQLKAQRAREPDFSRSAADADSNGDTNQGMESGDDGGEGYDSATIKCAVAEESDLEVAFIDDMFALLSTNSLPKPEEGQDMDVFTEMLRESIFVPTIGRGEYALKPGPKPRSKLESNLEVDAVPDCAETNVDRGNGMTQDEGGTIDSPEGTNNTSADKFERLSSQGLNTGTTARSESVESTGAVREALRGLYGTHQQSVILVRPDGTVTMVERTLYGPDADPVAPGEGQRRFDFEIEGW